MNDTVTVDFRWRERYNFESNHVTFGYNYIIIITSDNDF